MKTIIFDNTPIILGSQVFFPFFWDNKNMDTFSKRLKDLRTERNIGQIELAKQLGVGKSVISLWEQGKCEPTLSNLVKIAKFFDVTIDYLACLE